MKKTICFLLITALLLYAAAGLSTNAAAEEGIIGDVPRSSLTTKSIPKYSGEPYATLNGNWPEFRLEDLRGDDYILCSPLDRYGRAGAAMACIGPSSLSSEPRGQIGEVYPSGWHTVRYDDRIEDHYLYNRCHLIGYQLGGGNAVPENLITGTRAFNLSGMLPFENSVAEYVRGTRGHVLYRVSPIYEGKDLLALGVQIEAYSLDDFGTGLRFNVFVYNVQPGVKINYRDGSSKADPKFVPAELPVPVEEETADADTISLGEWEADLPEGYDADDFDREVMSPTFILNINTHKFHHPWCKSVADMKEKNRKEFFGTREELILEGYTPCSICNP